MRIVEIPCRTLEDEIAQLRDVIASERGASYIAGAIDAIQWLLDRRASPSDIVHNTLLEAHEALRKH